MVTAMRLRCWRADGDAATEGGRQCRGYLCPERIAARSTGQESGDTKPIRSASIVVIPFMTSVISVG